MKPLVIYHKTCADGFGAAFAAWLVLGDDADYLAMQYGEPFDTGLLLGPRARDVYIVDFSFPRQTMDHIFEHANRVVWRDHHKTAFEMAGATGLTLVESTSWPLGSNDLNQHSIILDNDKCGAMLAWEYFLPHKEVPQFIRHLDDYDRWQFKIEGTKEFNKALWSYTPWTFQQWRGILFGMDQNGDEHLYHLAATGLYEEGAAILRAHDANVRAVVKGSTRKIDIHVRTSGLPNTSCYAGLVANCPPFLTSDVGHELATESGTFGLCWTLKQEGMIANCSLRSNGDYDVSAIAKAFGGGGHKNAAGFEVPIEILLGWMK